MPSAGSLVLAGLPVFQRLLAFPIGPLNRCGGSIHANKRHYAKKRSRVRESVTTMSLCGRMPPSTADDQKLIIGQLTMLNFGMAWLPDSINDGSPGSNVQTSVKPLFRRKKSRKFICEGTAVLILE